MRLVTHIEEDEGTWNTRSRIRMTEKRLQNKQIAILVADGFEQEEMTRPRDALRAVGAQTTIISDSSKMVKGWDHTDWGDKFEVDVPLKEADASHYDALLLPGGVMNPDSLRRNEMAQEFVRHFFAEGKPVAAICHAPWLLIDTGLAVGRRLTSYPSIRTDLENADAQWVDEEVVIDDLLITSRSPKDIPAFNEAIIAEFAKEPARAA
jgi:protease I